MNLFRRLWPRSIRNHVLSLYKTGITRAENDDHRGAMEAYTQAIESADAPDDLRAMALYNRALLLAADGDIAQALADLRCVMAMPGQLADVKLAARRRLERLQHRLDAVSHKSQTKM